MNGQFQTIARTLAAEIAAEAYPVGTALPNREQLARRFGVARATIDKSVGILVERGLIRSRRGSGSVVLRRISGHRIGMISSYGVPVAPEGLDCTVELLHDDDLSKRSERALLSRFDGLVWHLPTRQHMAWARELEGDVPQILINRHCDDFNYVSTDHAGAVYTLTLERLELLPNALPVFLTLQDERAALVGQQRESAFVAACRELGRFYETMAMPTDFDEKLRCLDERFASHDFTMPLLLVSAFVGTAGAVCYWCRRRNLKWRKDVWYSDFDNDLPEHIWGVNVTTFVQDYQKLFEAGLSRLLDLVRGIDQRVHNLVPPVRRDADT